MHLDFHVLLHVCLQRDRLELELETMKQKCDAWRQEGEKLIPLKNEMQQLRAHISELEEQCEQLRSDNDGLSRQLQSIVEESERKQAEMERKGTDYDVLMQRFIELQQIRATLENELGPLREEREAIFRENAQLKESSQPEKYAKLKEEHALLLQQCEHYQTALENERAQVKLQQQTNVQLQQTLNEATNPEQLQKQEASSKLQEYETRMRRYREECDQARVSTRALEVQISRLQGTVNDLIRQSQAQAAATTDSSGSDKSELEEQCERLSRITMASVDSYRGLWKKVKQNKHKYNKRERTMMFSCRGLQSYSRSVLPWKTSWAHYEKRGRQFSGKMLN